jgi:hypothetical protein
MAIHRRALVRAEVGGEKPNNDKKSPGTPHRAADTFRNVGFSLRNGQSNTEGGRDVDQSRFFVNDTRSLL